MQKAPGSPGALVLATCLLVFFPFAAIFLFFTTILFLLAACVVFDLNNLHIATTFFFFLKQFFKHTNLLHVLYDVKQKS